MEAFWQNVDQETADELARLERHLFIAAGSFDPVVLVGEGHAAVVGGDQTTV